MTAIFEPLAPESPMTFDDFGCNTPITLLWGSGGRTGTVSPRRLPTPEERLLRDLNRGGFPMTRQDPCAARKTILITGGKGGPGHRVPGPSTGGPVTA